MIRSASRSRTTRVVGEPEVTDHLDRPRVQVDAAATTAARTDRGTLVHQRRQRDVPTVVDVAEAIVVGNAHLVEEDLVEARPTGHLAQRSHLDTGRLHVDDEPGESLVLRQVGSVRAMISPMSL